MQPPPLSLASTTLYHLNYPFLHGTGQLECLPPLSHCPRLLQPTTPPTPPLSATVPVTLRQDVSAAMQAALQTIGVSPPPPPPSPPPPPHQLPMGSTSYNAPMVPTPSPQSGPPLGMPCRCIHVYMYHAAAYTYTCIYNALPHLHPPT